MRHTITVFAPATVANVGCGFDIFGFALDTPGDELTVELTHSDKVVIRSVTGDNSVLSLDPEKNTAGVGVLKLLDHLKNSIGVEIELHKKMPLGSGLGSSAASAVGSLFAVNYLLGSPLTASQLIPFAMEAERVACGAAHADNVAPGLLGGFVIVRSYKPLDIIKIPRKLDLYCTILHPKIEISTREARNVLKKEVSLQQHLETTGNVAGFVAALMQGDAELLRRSLQDVIVEPVRAPLIPGFYQIKNAALEAGSLGCSISGSGPSIFALSLSHEEAVRVGEAMQKGAAQQAYKTDLYISKINEDGPRIVG